MSGLCCCPTSGNVHKQQSRRTVPEPRHETPLGKKEMATKESTPTTTPKRIIRRRRVEESVERENDIVEYIRHDDTEQLISHTTFIGSSGSVRRSYTVGSFSHFRIFKDTPPERWLELYYAFAVGMLGTAAGCCRQKGGNLTIQFVTKELDSENPAYCNETVHGNREDGSYFHPNCKQCKDAIQFLSTKSLVMNEANIFSRENPIDLTTST